MRALAPSKLEVTERSPHSSPVRRRFGPFEMVRLWFSYQRYALLMAGAPLLVVTAVAVTWPDAWWAWALLALASLPFLRFAAEIYGRWPRKIRATMLADRRIAAGRFNPRMVSRYCGDPCFRVVAREILGRADITGAERRRLIHDFSAEEAERGHTLVFAQPDGSVQIHVDGKSIRRLSNPGATAPDPEEN